MEVTKFLKPKPSGSTVVNNYGFASTSSNSGSNGSVTVAGDVITASQVDVTDNLTATQATIQSLTAAQGNITNLSSSSASISNLTVSQNATFNGNLTSYATTDQYGDLTTHGNVTFASSPQYGNAFDFSQVVSYMGSHNYFDELIGGKGSSMSVESINADYLTVNKSAHFFELVIDKIKAAGGCALFTPADGFTIDKIDLEAGSSYAYIYWRACSEITNETEGTLLENATTPPTESVTANMWREDDQALCQSFNLTDGAGTYQDISNKYWWTLVRSVSEQPQAVTIDGGNQYWMHWIKVYASDDSGQNLYMAAGSGTPEVGDTVSMLGNRTDTTRQGAIVISAYPTYMDRGDTDHVEMRAPYFAEYTGVNDFDLAPHRRNWIAANSTTLQGNIRLTSGDSIEDYVDDKISDIQTGDQFYTNVLTFSNQNINVPASSTGVPVSGNYYTYLYAMHGNNTLTITSIAVANSSYFTISGVNTREGCITLSTINTTSLPNDQNIFDVTVQATTGGTSPATITYDAKLFINKIKDGQKGADGLTPIIYELSSTSTSRSWNTNATTPSASPSNVTIRVNAIDQSKETDKISNISSIPSGMSLWYRTYNHNTNQYSGYQNVTSNYNGNGYYTINLATTTPYSIEIYLNLQETGSFDASKIYDSISIPLIYAGKNGTDGTNGTNGVDGTNVSVDMTSMKASVSKTDVLTMSLVGRLLWREGDMVDDDHDWTGYKIDVTNDNNYQTGSNAKRPANAMRQENIQVTASNGQFSWQPSSIAQYHSYNYSYRPTTLYVNVKDGSSYTVASFNVPVTFEAGATLDITNEINAYVTANTGEIASLKITAQGLRTDVDNNAGAISTLQQTATGISADISYIKSNYTQNSYLQSNYSTTAAMNAAIAASATGIMSQVSNSYETKSDADNSYNALYSNISQTADQLSLSVNSEYNYNEYNMLKKTLCLNPDYFVGDNISTPFDSIWDRSSIDDETAWFLKVNGTITSGTPTYANTIMKSSELYNGCNTLKYEANYIGNASPHTYLNFLVDNDAYSGATTTTNMYFSIYVKKNTDKAFQNITLSVQRGILQSATKNVGYGWTGDNVEIGGNSTAGTDGGYVQFRIRDDEWHRIWIRVRPNSTALGTTTSAYLIPMVWIYGGSSTSIGDKWLINQMQFEQGSLRTYGSSDNIAGQLVSTGIDIEQGKITLNADNTIVNGDLDLKGKFTSEKASEWRKVLIDAEEGDIVIYGPTSVTNNTPQGPYKKMLQIGSYYDENEVSYGTLTMGIPNDQDGQLSNPDENSNNWNTSTEIIQGNGGLDTLISQVSPNNRTRIMPNSITQENYNWDVDYDQSNLQSAGLDIQHYTATGASGARTWEESHHFSVGADGLSFVKDVDYIDPTPINIRPIYTTSGTNRISGRITLTSYNASNTQTNNVELSPEGVYLYYNGETHFKSWANIMGL